MRNIDHAFPRQTIADMSQFASLARSVLAFGDGHSARELVPPFLSLGEWFNDVILIVSKNKADSLLEAFLSIGACFAVA